MGINITLLPTHRQSQTSCQKDRAFNLVCFGMEEGTEACELLPQSWREETCVGQEGREKAKAEGKCQEV